jgi:hypothetical protein
MATQKKRTAKKAVVKQATIRQLLQEVLAYLSFLSKTYTDLDAFVHRIRDDAEDRIKFLEDQLKKQIEWNLGIESRLKKLDWVNN